MVCVSGGGSSLPIKCFIDVQALPNLSIFIRQPICSWLVTCVLINEKSRNLYGFFYRIRLWVCNKRVEFELAPSNPPIYRNIFFKCNHLMHILNVPLCVPLSCHQNCLRIDAFFDLRLPFLSDWHADDFRECDSPKSQRCERLPNCHTNLRNSLDRPMNSLVSLFLHTGMPNWAYVDRPLQMAFSPSMV